MAPSVSEIARIIATALRVNQSTAPYVAARQIAGLYAAPVASAVGTRMDGIRTGHEPPGAAG